MENVLNEHCFSRNRVAIFFSEDAKADPGACRKTLIVDGDPLCFNINSLTGFARTIAALHSLGGDVSSHDYFPSICELDHTRAARSRRSTRLNRERAET